MPVYRFKWGEFVLLLSPVGAIAVDMQEPSMVRVHMLGGPEHASVLQGESAQMICKDMALAHGMAESQKQGVEELLAGMQGKGGTQ